MLRPVLLFILSFVLLSPSLNKIADARTTQIRCDSDNNRTTRCPVNGRPSQVRLTRQRSSAPCDGNWNYRDGMITVRNGCRGDFEVRIDNSGGFDDDYARERYQEFRGLPNISRFIVDRQSYYDSRRIREFDAIVNGTRERWWANCRGGDLGTGSRELSSSRTVDRIVDFVCNDQSPGGNRADF
jgi:hypothetical protein